jgi:predicted nucleic acid-binding protein
VIFVDTGAFLARHLARDQHHRRSVAAWQELPRRDWRVHTSNFVLDETFTLLGRWVSHAFAADRAEAILTSSYLEILRPDSRDELEALELFRKFADQKVSYTDCISFALMRRFGIVQAFAFDRHFVQAGFDLWPGD